MPLYLEIADELARRIAASGLRPGARIESEHELSDEFGVSRGTVVRALAELQSRGIVNRHQGRGTFVLGRPMLESTTKLASFTDTVASMDRVPGSVVLSWTATTAAPDDPMHRALPTGTPVLDMERLRTIDGIPIGLHRVVLPADVADEINVHDHLDQQDWSLYGLLSEAGLYVDRGHEEFTARLASADEAARLDASAPLALLCIERHTRDVTGRLLEVVDARYHPGRYSVTATGVRSLRSRSHDASTS